MSCAVITSSERLSNLSTLVHGTSDSDSYLKTRTDSYLTDSLEVSLTGVERRYGVPTAIKLRR
jgi:hypothetical protein